MENADLSFTFNVIFFIEAAVSSKLPSRPLLKTETAVMEQMIEKESFNVTQQSFADLIQGM